MSPLCSRRRGRIIGYMIAKFETNELIFKGRVAEMHRVKVRMPDGKLVDREFVHFSGASVILPVLADGSIVLIRNYRFAVDEHLYELPAGILENDEDPACCAARELTEETGYVAGTLEDMGMFYPGPGVTDERMFAFLATDLTAGRQNLEQYEQIIVEVHSDSDVRQMVLDGTIHDGKTIAALSLYWLRAGRC